MDAYYSNKLSQDPLDPESFLNLGQLQGCRGHLPRQKPHCGAD